MFTVSVLLLFVYHIFCKKYERELVKQKEEETARLEENNERGDVRCPIFPEHGETTAYWGTQIVGISKLWDEHLLSLQSTIFDAITKSNLLTNFTY